jgi:hypothetical protein
MASPFGPHSDRVAGPMSFPRRLARVCVLVLLLAGVAFLCAIPIRVIAQSSGRDGGSSSGSVSSIPAYATSGQVWREYNIVPYTSRLPNSPHPESAIMNWVIRQTGSETWHGEEVAVLSATRGRLKVFHNTEVQDHVAEIVERFTRPIQAQATIRVQSAVTADLGWRSEVLHLLKPVALGPEGQQAWLVPPEDAALIRSRLQPDRVPGPLNQQLMATNGQANIVESVRSVSYVSGLELAGGSHLAYQPVIAKLQEGVQLTLTPLWTRDGAAVDLVVDLMTRAVTKLHFARGTAPLSSGVQELVQQVPQAGSTHFEQTLRWPTSQVLVISGGVQPNSNAKRGTLGFGSPTSELVILAEIAAPVRSSARRDLPGEP